MRQYIVVNEGGDVIVSRGVYNDLNTAIGKVMMCIWATKVAYQPPVDHPNSKDFKFIVIGPEILEAESGWVFSVEFGYNDQELSRDAWYILINDTKEEGEDSEEPSEAQISKEELLDKISENSLR